MKYTLLALLFSLTMSGCASTATSSKLAEIDRTTLTCSGIKSWHDCRTAALDVCPNGYNIKNELENVLIQRREVEIACKA